MPRIGKTEASNQRNFRRTKRDKQALGAAGPQLVDDARKSVIDGQAKGHAAANAGIELAAEKLEKGSSEFDEDSEARMHQHHRQAQATTALEVAIVMATSALLSRRRWPDKAGAMCAVGVVVGALADLHA
jgi:hypothetical protein